jgi:DNA-3-methyladenine glycosylase I
LSEIDKMRCRWASGGSALMRAYHDEEWGAPVHDDRRLFEFLILEGAQAGLSWETVLRKRERYRVVLDGFDWDAISGYDDEKKSALLADPGIIRNRSKIDAAVVNARAFQRLREEEGSFDAWVWAFVGGVPLVSRREDEALPARTELSDRVSRSLVKRGFKFVGTTICYAFLQAVGVVDDHDARCFRAAVPH